MTRERIDVDIPAGKVAFRLHNNKHLLVRAFTDARSFPMEEGEEVWVRKGVVKRVPTQRFKAVEVGHEWHPAAHILRKVVALETNEHGTYAFVKETSQWNSNPLQVKCFQMNVNNIPAEVEEGPPSLQFVED